MRTKHITILALTLCVLLIVLWKWEGILWSLTSFFATIILAIVYPGDAQALFSVSLVEYWIAAIVLVIVCWFLMSNSVRIIRGVSGERKWSVSTMILLSLIIIAAAGPIVSPVPPNVQGNLVSTRLLPPFSLGSVEIVESSREGISGAGWLDGIRVRANSFLLNRQIRMSGIQQDGSPLKTSNEPSPMVFLFGSDDAGRDVLSRMIAGARVSLAIGGIVAVGSVVIATLIGFLAGYSNSFVDSVLMRLTDLFLAIPSLFLVVGVIAFLGQSLTILIVILALTGWMSVARTIRTEVRKLREKEFVHAARMLNLPSHKILIKHLLPNLKPILLTALLLQFGNAMLAEAALSFLGLGVQPPTASWGNLLGQSVSYLRTGWWLAVFPGLMLSCVLVSIHQKFESSGGHA
ncbi:MAG: ABC transporter permease [Ignavibacteriae bacterium]|nr:ABC transporter permease [Ignavibacteriota bacterium]